MAVERPSESRTLFKLANGARFAFWLLLIGLVLFQVIGARDTTQIARESLISRLQSERKSRVIALIHRQESQSILGLEVASYIDIEDSEAVLRAIRLTPDEQPIDVILHTPGGLVLAAEQIAKALADHKSKVTVFVPHYAMSGGTLIAMAAAEIVMDPNAVLGPVDPQIGDMAAASILKAVEIKKAKADDQTLMLADLAAKARVQVASFVADLLSRRVPRAQAEKLAIALSEGRWTHDFPITVEAARQMGFPVTTDMPRVVYELMDLYPQANTRRPSVIYVPVGSPGPAQGDTDKPKSTPHPAMNAAPIRLRGGRLRPD
jgi:ClpP class serine protease